MTPPRRRRSVRRGDVVAGALVVTLGAVLLVAARGIERLPGDTEAIGPATFPTVLSLLLVLAGIALMISGLRGVTDEGIAAALLEDDDSEDVNELIDPDEPPVPVLRLLVVVGAFAAYCFALIPLGFLLSTAGFLAGVTCLVDASKWKRNLLFAVGFSAVVYFAFTRLLAVELPAGLLG